MEHSGVRIAKMKSHFLATQQASFPMLNVQQQMDEHKRKSVLIKKLPDILHGNLLMEAEKQESSL